MVCLAHESNVALTALQTAANVTGLARQAFGAPSRIRTDTPKRHHLKVVRLPISPSVQSKMVRSSGFEPE